MVKERDESDMMKPRLQACLMGQREMVSRQGEEALGGRKDKEFSLGHVAFQVATGQPS